MYYLSNVCVFVGMRILVTLLLDTLPMLGNVLLLCFFVFFIFGIVGVQLWAGLLRNRCFLDEDARMWVQMSVLFLFYHSASPAFITESIKEMTRHAFYPFTISSNIFFFFFFKFIWRKHCKLNIIFISTMRMSRAGADNKVTINTQDKYLEQQEQHKGWTEITLKQTPLRNNEHVAANTWT